ncbi:MAG TPA: hypothetical protein VGD21_12695 [Lysobacter sp.]
MATVTCRRCKQGVSDAVMTCPHCGTRAPSIGIGGLIAIFSVVAVLGWVIYTWDDDMGSPPPEAISDAAPGVSPEPAVSGCRVPNREDGEKFATILNLNGLLCAKTVEVCPLKVDALEVTCIEYRGGKATKTYIIDTKNGSAFPQ